MKNWIEQLQPIIIEYRGSEDDPLDGDGVDRLCEIIKAKINLHEGNISDAEYEDLLDGGSPQREEENFKKQYRDLEQRVLRELRDKIENSKINSKHVDTKSLPVNIFDYTELVIVNDRLTFLDKEGMHYSLFADVILEDLIDLLNEE